MSLTQSVGVKKGHGYMVKTFAKELYGAPYGHNWGEGLMVQQYPGFNIESRTNPPDGNYEIKIIFSDSINNEIKSNLVALATRNDFKFQPEIKKIADNIKSNFPWRFKSFKGGIV